MLRRLVALTVLGISCSFAFDSGTARADGRFSFGLSLWGPPPVYYGRPYYYEPYYPPPVVVRRVYVPVQPEPVFVAPAQPAAPSPQPVPSASRRGKQVDLVLVKIGELHSEDNDEREDAAKWLGAAHDPRAIRPLIEVLQHDPKDDVREEAARALGELGGLDAERALTIATSNDMDSSVRRTASKSLARMAKQTTQTTHRSSGPAPAPGR